MLALDTQGHPIFIAHLISIGLHIPSDLISSHLICRICYFLASRTCITKLKSYPRWTLASLASDIQGWLLNEMKGRLSPVEAFAHAELYA